MAAMHQNARVDAQVHQRVASAVQRAQAALDQADQQAKVGTAKTPQASTAPVALPPIPVGGGRLIIDRQGDRTVITSAALPPELIPVVKMAQETALGLMGLLAAMVILGPIARMFARRMDRTAELNPGASHAKVLQQQMLQLQQSLDAVSVEVERISESQRFQSKLLNESRPGPRSDR